MSGSGTCYLASVPGVPRWFVDDCTDLGARLAVVKGGSHAFPSERAEEVAGIVRGFLGQ